MAHPAPFSKTEPLHWHALSLRCSTLLYNSLRHPTHAQNLMPIFGVAASDRHATLHDCTLVYDTHDAVYATIRCETIRAVLHAMTWCEYTVGRSISRYVTLPHAVYGLCTPSRCVCTQFCCVRHLNVSICEPRMKRT